MPYKIIGTIPPPPRDPLCAYEATLLAKGMAENEGAERFYWGNPHREIGQIVETKNELLYDRNPLVPQGIRNLWHKLFPHRSWVWGVYVEVSS